MFNFQVSDSPGIFTTSTYEVTCYSMRILIISIRKNNVRHLEDYSEDGNVSLILLYFTLDPSLNLNPWKI